MFHVFRDPSEFVASLDSNVELIPFGPDPFEVRLAAAQLPNVRVRSFQETKPRIAHVQHPRDRAYFAFVPDPHGTPVVVDGMEVRPGDVLMFGRDCLSHQRRTAPGGWTSLSLTLDRLGELTGESPPPPQARLLTRPAVWHRLSALQAAATSLPSGPLNETTWHDAAWAIDQSLLQTISECMLSLTNRQEGPGRLRHKVLLGRFRTLLDANMDRALYLPEVCAALGISQRTLTHVCQEYLGMAAKKYFWLRRMHMARRALLTADPASATVTEIATHYGFWELGRFSVHYRALFGEKPSVTLHGSAGKLRGELEDWRHPDHRRLRVG